MQHSHYKMIKLYHILYTTNPSVITRDNVAETPAVRVIMQKHGPIFVLFHSKRGCIHLLKTKMAFGL